MVYHYFGSKSGLYIAVLEQAMGELRAAELKLDVGDTTPLLGLLQLFDFIHDHFDANPQLISLLSTENLAQARYLKQSATIPAMSSPVPKLIERLVRRGASGRLDPPERRSAPALCDDGGALLFPSLQRPLAVGDLRRGPEPRKLAVGSSAATPAPWSSATCAPIDHFRA